MPNLYCSLADVKNELGETSSDTVRDAILIMMIEDASRQADAYCNRHFFLRTATKYVDVLDARRVLIDDCLNISTLTGDSESDGTFDGTTYAQGDTADYVLWPDDQWPKLMIMPAISPDNALACRKRYLKAVGLWGYGDGESATPYRAITLTGTVATTTGTTLTASGAADAVIYPGQTLLVGSEQMYVSAVSGTSVTVERGVNGTTAATQAAAAMSIYKYPREVSRYVIEATKDFYVMRKSGDFQMEMIGQYQYQRSGANLSEFRTDKLLGTYRRMVV